MVEKLKIAYYNQTMIEYNLKVITKLLSSLSLLIKTNISIFDDDFVSSDARNLNVFPFCSLIKNDVRTKCASTDKSVIERMKKQDAGFFYYCHFGLVEMILKFNVDAKSSFYILIGPFRDIKKYQENIKHIEEYCDLFKKDKKIIIKKYKDIPRFTLDKYNAIVDMITIIANYAKTTKLISSKNNFLENELNAYIDEHLQDKIKVEDICKKFFLSSKQLERIVKLYATTTPKKYILKYKINKAYHDIKFSDDSFSNIAEKYGFDDYNYFVRIFKKYKGIVPSKLRKIKDE